MRKQIHEIHLHIKKSEGTNNWLLIIYLRSKKNHRQRRQLIAHQQPKSPISEQYRNIRTNIEFAAVDTNIHSINDNICEPE